MSKTIFNLDNLEFVIITSNDLLDVDHVIIVILNKITLDKYHVRFTIDHILEITNNIINNVQIFTRILADAFNENNKEVIGIIIENEKDITIKISVNAPYIVLQFSFNINKEVVTNDEFIKLYLEKNNMKVCDLTKDLNDLTDVNNQLVSKVNILEDSIEKLTQRLYFIETRVYETFDIGMVIETNNIMFYDGFIVNIDTKFITNIRYLPYINNYKSICMFVLIHHAEVWNLNKYTDKYYAIQNINNEKHFLRSLSEYQLKKIQLCEDLEEFYIDGNPIINSISFLENMKIKRILISNCINFNDISVVNTLNELEYLHIHKCPNFINCTPLKDHPTLKTLILTETGVTNLISLEKNIHLTIKTS